MLNLTYPTNEPIRMYEPGSVHRQDLKKALKQIESEVLDIPCWIDGQEVRTGRLRTVVMPHDHQHILARFHLAGEVEMKRAAAAALSAKPAWEAMAWDERAMIFLKAAELIAGPYRNLLNAATMLGQSKNVFQAEIDAACELIDFLRFNAYFYQELLKSQPHSVQGCQNRMEYRPLEGFVLAIAPFNFTAIAGNLAAAPALMGNTVVWKPSDTQMLAAHYTRKIFQEAGLPNGVINLIGADGLDVGKTLVPMKDLAGIHFTGSTETFRTLWRTVGQSIETYRSYPRLVGETGGKDFVFAHPTADVQALSTGLIRGAFEYQGQKCSAASRAYLPQSLWKRMEDAFLDEISHISMGDVRDFRHFVNAVIDEKAFQRNTDFIQHARAAANAKILVGGQTDSKQGYFVRPTVIEVADLDYKSMREEIFGPILSLYVYPDTRMEEVLMHCAESSKYALTGAIFTQDRSALQSMTRSLRYAAGNLYINDKPTGATVGQQPFGGGRASGTNDKAGSPLNLLRWVSPLTVKETLIPSKQYQYPFMLEE